MRSTATTWIGRVVQVICTGRRPCCGLRLLYFEGEGEGEGEGECRSFKGLTQYQFVPIQIQYGKISQPPGVTHGFALHARAAAEQLRVQGIDSAHVDVAGGSTGVAIGASLDNDAHLIAIEHSKIVLSVVDGE